MNIDQKAVENNKFDKLAINGGEPVRTEPLPPESPGIHFIDDEEIKLVTSVITAKSPFRYYGPDMQNMCDQLEDLFRERMKRKYALAVSSGTEGLHISLAAIGVGPGDEVLLPGYLWTSCINAIVRLGAIPRLVDIDDTFTMSPEDLKRKVGKHSKAIILIHMSGAPGNVEPIIQIAKENGLAVLEDCAQSNGGTQNGKPVGSFGDIGIVSFQINKSVTSGEGGMIFTDSEELYKRSFALHDLGYARDNKGVLMDTACEEKYHLWGCGARMSELSGAMALAQMRKIDRINSTMRSAKWKIRQEVEKIEPIRCRTIPDPEGDTGAFLITIYPDREICHNFTNALRAEGMLSTGYANPCVTMENWGLHWYFNNKSLVNRRSLHTSGWPWTCGSNAFSKNYNYAKGELPTCDEYSSRAGLFKISAGLTEKDSDDIITAFKKVARAMF
jgi:dTDP-4-amino-4,6-dideoxygalactose transaminase